MSRCDLRKFFLLTEWGTCETVYVIVLCKVHAKYTDIF